MRNLHQADLKSTEKHNARMYAPGERPANIVGTEFTHTQTGNTLEEAVQARFEKAKVKARTDSVVAIEYVVAISPDAMDKISNQHNGIEADFIEELTKFVEEKHGKQNVISTSIHLDESNPHAHVIVTPILEKRVQWKNSNGQGVRVENRLCARDFTGDKEKLRQLQTDYYNFLHENKLVSNLINSCNCEIKRGVDARDRRAKNEYYSKMTDHVLGGILKEFRKLKNDVEKGLITMQEFKRVSDATEKQIGAVRDNIEKKMGKDAVTFKKGEKWANTSRGLGL